jgi:hypothetical protein
MLAVGDGDNELGAHWGDGCENIGTTRHWVSGWRMLRRRPAGRVLSLVVWRELAIVVVGPNKLARELCGHPDRARTSGYQS